MPEKVRSKQDLILLKDIVRGMWAFQGFSIRKIQSAFNSNEDYVSKYGTVSLSSVAIYVREIRRELEEWLDEDVIEKYTAEFVRKRHIMEQQIENIRTVQGYIDVKNGDLKDKELFLKFEVAMHEIGLDQMKLLTDVELVLHIKKYAKERRLKTETLVLLPDKDRTAEDRGYIIPSLTDISDTNDLDKPEINLTCQ